MGARKLTNKERDGQTNRKIRRYRIKFTSLQSETKKMYKDGQRAQLQFFIGEDNI